MWATARASSAAAGRAPSLRIPPASGAARPWSPSHPRGTERGRRLSLVVFQRPAVLAVVSRVHLPSRSGSGLCGLSPT